LTASFASLHGPSNGPHSFAQQRSSIRTSGSTLNKGK
jgi:hypothetical protein